jgi:hypothetical protein
MSWKRVEAHVWRYDQTDYHAHVQTYESTCFDAVCGKHASWNDARCIGESGSLATGTIDSCVCTTTADHGALTYAAVRCVVL